MAVQVRNKGLRRPECDKTGTSLPSKELGLRREVPTFEAEGQLLAAPDKLEDAPREQGIEVHGEVVN